MPNNTPDSSVVPPDPEKGNYEEITYQSSLYSGVKNPYTGYVWIKLPNEKVSMNKRDDFIRSFSDKEVQNASLLYDRPKNFVSFSLSRICYGIGDFNLVLFDQNFTEIEKKLLANGVTIAFKYGYSNNIEKASPWYKGVVTGMQIKFTFQGSYIYLSGVSTGVETTTLNGMMSKKLAEIGNVDTHKSINEVVREIAKKLGEKEDDVELILEETVKIPSKDGVDDPSTSNKNILRPADCTIMDYLKDYLAPISQSKEQVNSKESFGPYQVYLELASKTDKMDKSNKGKIKLHFHTISYLARNQDKNKKTPLFTLYKNPNTVVRDFSPNWGFALAHLAAGVVEGVSYDPYSKEIISHRVDLTSNIYADTKNPMGKETKLIETSEYSCNTWLQSGARMRSSLSAQVEQAKGFGLVGANEATLIIQGTTEFKVGDKIAVHVYIPKGEDKIDEKTGKNKVHWCSGDFIIIGIQDNVSNGDFSTTLKLAYGGRPAQISYPDEEKARTPMTRLG